MTLSLQKKHTLNAERYFRSLNILILDINKILEKRKFNSSFIFNILFLNFGLNNRNFLYKLLFKQRNTVEFFR